jgi:prephenate dehydratase
MHMATMAMFPNADVMPCKTFDQAFDAAKSGLADHAMIAIDNSLAGRVADVHHLLPESGLFITGEIFLPINHCLLGVEGTTLETITHVHSHVHALPQCRAFINKNKYAGVVHADTAGAAADIAKMNDRTQAAIASRLAADIYGLTIIVEGIQDDTTNTTRFVVLSREPKHVPATNNVMTSFVFEVRNIPAALYKAMGGFATNGVNMMKLESYVDSSFNAARFYCEVEGHPDQENLRLALEELQFFAKHIQIMGTFEKSVSRKELNRP